MANFGFEDKTGQAGNLSYTVVNAKFQLAPAEGHKRPSPVVDGRKIPFRALQACPGILHMPVELSTQTAELV
ncbi:MAG: hypothetical protein LBP55_09590 [Candidatus Adiutrix sp.]|jgi:hypothetical protein|nr:hypothetical protein [Candidatus Adiutrix sp.]